jgi:FixJ family two-component response regulator
VTKFEGRANSIQQGVLCEWLGQEVHSSSIERAGSCPHIRAEVLPLVVSGLLNKQIAANLGTSEATVKVHRSQLMRKLGADSLADLVRMAEKLGIRAAKPNVP